MDEKIWIRQIPMFLGGADGMLFVYFSWL